MKHGASRSVSEHRASRSVSCQSKQRSELLRDQANTEHAGASNKDQRCCETKQTQSMPERRCTPEKLRATNRRCSPCDKPRSDTASRAHEAEPEQEQTQSKPETQTKITAKITGCCESNQTQSKPERASHACEAESEQPAVLNLRRTGAARSDTEQAEQSKQSHSQTKHRASQRHKQR